MSDSGNPPRGDEPADGENAAPPERGDASSPKWWTGSEAKREFQDPSGSEEPRPANNWFGDGWTARRPEETTSGRPTPPPASRPTQPAPNQTGPNQPGPGQAGRPSQPAAGQPSRPSSTQPPAGPARPARSGPAASGPAQSRPAQSGPTASGRQQPPYSAPPQQSAPQARAPQQPPAQGRPVQSGPAQGGPPPQQSGGSYLWSPPEQQAQQSSGPRHAAGGGPVGPMGQPVQQPPTWQYPPIPIPQPPGAGRRRKPRKTPRALLIGLVVLAVVVVGTGITLLIGNLNNDEAAPPPANPSQPAETPSADPQPSATPTGPDTAAADKVVNNSNLYAVGLLVPSKCPEPPFVPTNFALATSYYNRLLACVNATWIPAMKKVKVKYRSPKVAVYNGKVASPCGVQRSVRAAYCGANETIYMPFAVDARAYRSDPLYARALMLSTFAHEYGHHVQKRTGILAASLERAQNMNAGQKLEESRRRELQASCLGAAYLGINSGFIPITGPLLQAYRSLISNSGDDFARPRVHDHGNKASNYQWNIAGFNTKRPGSCNTFKAGQARVA